VLAAIVIVEPELPEGPHCFSPKVPFACVEILGRSILTRTVSELGQAGIEAITVLADERIAPQRPDIESSSNEIPRVWVNDVWESANQKFTTHEQSGAETILIIRVAAYAEIDVEEILEFHRIQSRGITRAFDTRRRPLDFWLVDRDRVPEGGSLRELLQVDPARYVLRGYINRLEHPTDLRRLVTDSFSSRCRLRPVGSETRPGVWVAEGAYVHRKARIVAPAFLGHGSKIDDSCLITRSSNVERNSEVDYGTVVEDSSIMANSYVGIALDITHSIVNGSYLYNLKRDVTLEIADAGIIRRTGSLPTSVIAPVLGSVQQSIGARPERRPLDGKWNSLFL
jgi:NDP-sugar pyrophosphorylase family protein